MGFFVEMLCFETWDSVLKYRLKYLIPFKHDESGFVAFAVGARDSGHFGHRALVA
jgi:hypothetical protein